MTLEELKLRRLCGQGLLAPESCGAVLERLCGVQCQYMAKALHALRLRCFATEGVPGEDTALKSWTLRGTMHLFSREDLPLFIGPGLDGDFRRNEWSAPSFWNSRDYWTLSPERQAYLSSLILEALSDSPKSRETLRELCLDSGMSGEEEACMFHPWGGGLAELCRRGFMAYLPRQEKIFCALEEYVPMEREAAELELCRRYFENMGPASIHDAMYFFRLPAARVKDLVSRLSLQTVKIGEREYYYSEKQDVSNKKIPACLFLAGFDPLLLAYEKKESPFLSEEHVKKVFGAGGTVSSAILINGSVKGRWEMKGGKLKAELFESISPAEKRLVTESAGRLWSELKAVDFC